MKSLIRYIDEGLLIPTEVLKELGSDISVQKYSNVIVIEARERAYARKKLTAMVQKLRSYGDTVEPPSEEELRKLVDQVREDIASYS